MSPGCPSRWAVYEKGNAMTALASEVFPIPQFDEEASGRKLCIICSKGSLDMAYPGLVLANAALGEGSRFISSISGAST